MHYDAVYQNSRAVKKHIIVRRPDDISRPGRYYIIRCDRHNVSFEDNPLQSASTHLRMKHKAIKTFTYDSVVDHLGCEVLGCDDEKVEENNSAARKAFERGDEGPTGDNIRVRNRSYSPEPQQRKKPNVQSLKVYGSKGRRTRWPRRHTDQQDDSSHKLDFTPGNVYIIYWTESKQWFAGVLLPLQDLASIGIHDSIEKIGLLKSLPDCYQYDTSDMSFSWTKGYEDGGPMSSEQQFAFVFFEGVKFPEESHVAWIPIHDIKEWDEKEAQMIEHSEQALEYLTAREENEPRELGSNAEIRDSADDSEDELSLFGPQSPLAESSVDPPPTQTNDPITPDTAEEPEPTELEQSRQKEELLQEELRQEELRQEELRQEELRQEELRQAELRQEELRQEELRQEEIQKAELRKAELRQEVLRQEALRKEEMRKEAAAEAEEFFLKQSQSEEQDEYVIMDTQEDDTEAVPTVAEQGPDGADDVLQAQEDKDLDIVMNTQEDIIESHSEQRNEEEFFSMPCHADEMDEEMIVETQDSIPSTPEQDPLKEVKDVPNENVQEMIIGIQKGKFDDIVHEKESKAFENEAEENEKVEKMEENRPQMFIDALEDTTEDLLLQDDPEDQDNSSSREPSLPHRPDSNRLSSADLANLLSECEDLEMHMSQSEQPDLDERPLILSTAKPAPFATMEMSTLDRELGDGPTSNPLADIGLPCGETPQRLTPYAEMGKKASASPCTSKSTQHQTAARENSVNPPRPVTKLPGSEPSAVQGLVKESETHKQSGVPSPTLSASLVSTPISSDSSWVQNTTQVASSAKIPFRGLRAPEHQMTEEPAPRRTVLPNAPQAIGVQIPSSVAASPQQSFVDVSPRKIGYLQHPHAQVVQSQQQATEDTYRRLSVTPRNPEAMAESPRRFDSRHNSTVSEDLKPQPVFSPGPARTDISRSPFITGEYSASGPLPTMPQSPKQIVQPSPARKAPTTQYLSSEIPPPEPIVAQQPATQRISSNRPPSIQVPQYTRVGSASKSLPSPIRSGPAQRESAAPEHPGRQSMSPPQHSPAAQHDSAAPYQTASQPTPSPRQYATKVSRPTSIIQNQPMPHVMTSPRLAAMSISRPGSVILCPPPSQTSQPPSPRRSAMNISRPGSVVQNITAPQVMPSPKQSAREILWPSRTVRSPSYVSSYQPSPELSRSYSQAYEHQGSHIASSPRQAAMSISRPGSATQHFVSYVAPSPRLTEMELARPNTFDYRHQLPLMASPRPAPMNFSRSGSVVQANAASQVMEPRAIMEPPQPIPTAYGIQRSPMMPSPRQMAGNLTRSNSTRQGYLASQVADSPLQPSMSLPRPNTAHGQLPSSPYQATIGLHRPGSSFDMQSSSADSSPQMSTTGFPKTKPRMNNRGSFQGRSLPPPIPSMNNYVPTAPEAHRSSRPRQEAVLHTNEPRRHSYSASPSYDQPYSYQSQSHAVESTPRSYQPAYQPANARNFNVSPVPLLSSLPRHIADLLLQRTGYTWQNHPDYQPSDFINYEGQYQCPFCRMRMSKAGIFVDHLQKLCPSTDKLSQAKKPRALRR
ncbi:hypothetical protein ACHAPQ_005708 [Fusarium lateritium]